MKYILLTFSVFYFFSFSALGQTFSCDRSRLDPQGFSSQGAAESWFNKKVTITADLDKKTATYKGSNSNLWIRDDNKRMKVSFVRKMRNGIRISVSFVFLANGEVHADLSQVGGYKSPGGAIYKCSGWTGSL